MTGKGPIQKLPGIGHFWRNHAGLSIVRPALLGAALMLCVLVAHSQNRPTSAAKVGEQSQIQIKDPLPKAAKDERGTEQFPIIVKTLPSEHTHTKSPTEQQHEEEKATLDRLIAVSTVVLAIVTTLLALYTFKLWRATVSLGRNAQNAAEQQARDTRQSLDIARDAANASKITADAIRDADSPYLFPELRGFKVRNGRPTALYVFRNYGNTPAVLNRFQDEPIYTQRLPAVPERTESLTERPERETVIPVNGTGPGSAITFGFPVGLSLDDFQVQYTQNRMRLYMIGRVGYEDLFGRAHIKDFCMEIVPRTDDDELPILFRVAGGKAYNQWHKDV